MGNLLTEERHRRILSLVEANHSISVLELTELLDTSESTIRRDLAVLDSEGRLIKVRGGAVISGSEYATKDDAVVLRQGMNMEEKRIIAKYAASLIEPDDFVYLDAGTTTGSVIDFLEEKRAVFVTNASDHARRLSEKGFTVYLLGGEYKAVTEAVVGEEAVENLARYNFTKGFWGANGAHPINGFSTPEVREAILKEKAMERCDKRYVLCDSSKFSRISCVTFAPFTGATVITTRAPKEGYSKFTNIVEVEK